MAKLGTAETGKSSSGCRGELSSTACRMGCAMSAFCLGCLICLVYLLAWRESGKESESDFERESETETENIAQFPGLGETLSGK